jgi:recombination protein RecA
MDTLLRIVAPRTADGAGEEQDPQTAPANENPAANGDASERLASSPPAPETSLPRWTLAALAGEMVEITSPGPTAGLTAAARLLREAQENGEPAAWITAGDSLPYPLDLAEGGCDLEALVFVRLRGLSAGTRAAEHLLRSGAFGLVVLDLGRQGGPRVPSAAAVRLAALCRRHQAVLLLLGRKPAEAEAVLPFAPLRVTAELRRIGFDRFQARLRPSKDKRRRSDWTHEEVCRGPDGLC